MEIYFFIANVSVVRLALTTPICSNQGQYLRFEEEVGRCLDLSPSNELKLRWIPSHTDIPGNDVADEEAKLAAAEAMNP